jgi:hypothetical protein
LLDNNKLEVLMNEREEEEGRRIIFFFLQDSDIPLYRYGRNKETKKQRNEMEIQCYVNNK